MRAATPKGVAALLLERAASRLLAPPAAVVRFGRPLDGDAADAAQAAELALALLRRRGSAARARGRDAVPDRGAGAAGGQRRGDREAARAQGSERRLPARRHAARRSPRRLWLRASHEPRDRRARAHRDRASSTSTRSRAGRRPRWPRSGRAPTRAKNGVLRFDQVLPEEATLAGGDPQGRGLSHRRASGATAGSRRTSASSRASSST